MPGPNVQLGGVLGEAAQKNAEGKPGLAVFNEDAEPLASANLNERLASQMLLELRRIRVGLSLLVNVDLENEDLS